MYVCPCFLNLHIPTSTEGMMLLKNRSDHRPNSSIKTGGRGGSSSATLQIRRSKENPNLNSANSQCKEPTFTMLCIVSSCSEELKAVRYCRCCQSPPNPFIPPPRHFTWGRGGCWSTAAVKYPLTFRYLVPMHTCSVCGVPTTCLLL